MCFPSGAIPAPTPTGAPALHHGGSGHVVGHLSRSSRGYHFHPVERPDNEAYGPTCSVHGYAMPSIIAVMR